MAVKKNNLNGLLNKLVAARDKTNDKLAVLAVEGGIGASSYSDHSTDIGGWREIFYALAAATVLERINKGKDYIAFLEETIRTVGNEAQNSFNNFSEETKKTLPTEPFEKIIYSRTFSFDWLAFEFSFPFQFNPYYRENSMSTGIEFTIKYSE